VATTAMLFGPVRDPSPVQLRSGELRKIASGPRTVNFRPAGLDDRKKSAQGNSVSANGPTIGRKVRAMIARSLTVVPVILLVAASAAAVVFATTHTRRPPLIEPIAATAAPSPPSSRGPDESTAVLAAVQTKANALAAELPVLTPAPATADSTPVFDVARIDRTGDAVIAGGASPGAIVELLRNGEPYDQAVASSSGQFVIVPPRLPAGNHELTLRSRLPDGTFATSKQPVAVTIDDIEPKSRPTELRAEVPFTPPLLPSPPTVPKQQDLPASQPLQTAAAAPLSRLGSSSSPVAQSKTVTTVVSRGDSLWRISRVAYGAGTQYGLVYKANRARIRDPDHIYPGQIFVLPMQGH
jgi:nucleoid-associated protein YgaU